MSSTIGASCAIPHKTAARPQAAQPMSLHGSRCLRSQLEWMCSDLNDELCAPQAECSVALTQAIRLSEKCGASVGYYLCLDCSATYPLEQPRPASGFLSHPPSAPPRDCYVLCAAALVWAPRMQPICILVPSSTRRPNSRQDTLELALPTRRAAEMAQLCWASAAQLPRSRAQPVSPPVRAWTQ